MRGLLALSADPDASPAVWTVSIMGWSAVMALELAFFLIRSVFRSASIHDAAVNADVQRRAVSLAHSLEDHVREHQPRPRFRVVGEDEPLGGG
jgi:hypothetical protein